MCSEPSYDQIQFFYNKLNIEHIGAVLYYLDENKNDKMVFFIGTPLDAEKKALKYWEQLKTLEKNEFVTILKNEETINCKNISISLED